MSAVSNEFSVDLLHELSADLVGYWKTQTIYSAVKLGVIDALPNTLSIISNLTKVKEQALTRLLRALWELNIAELNDNNIWVLTPKGQMLKPTTTSSMAAAAIIWAKSHYHQWQFLAETLIDNQRDRTQYFTDLASDPNLLSIYQTALTGYALNDYKNLLDLSCWVKHTNVIDAGGGRGVLLHQLCLRYPHLKGYLIDLPEVIQQIPIDTKLKERCEYKGLDFFEPWNVSADAIIFSRVLHDWPDHLALQILLNAKQSLKPGGKLYILEMILEDNSSQGGLLDLNMLVMTGGRERTHNDWKFLFSQASLSLTHTQSISPIISVLTVEPIQ